MTKQGNQSEKPEQSCYRVRCRRLWHCESENLSVISGLRRFVVSLQRMEHYEHIRSRDLARAAKMPLFCIVFLYNVVGSNDSRPQQAIHSEFFASTGLVALLTRKIHSKPLTEGS